MLKKTLIGGGTALLVSGLMFGRDAVSYVSTSAGWVKQSIAESVPVEFQIERAKQLIGDLEPEIQRNKHLIVREEVALERLAEQVATLDSTQTRSKHELLKMSSAMKQGDAYLVFAGTQYTRDQVERDMANRLARHKTNEETLFNLRRVLNARQQTLAAARTELDQMLASRRQLAAEVEKLEARQTMVTVAETSSEFDLDSSVLARASQLIKDVETQLDVRERMLNSEIQFAEEIPVSETAHADIVSQVADYFGDSESSVASIAAEVTTDPQL